MSDNSIQEISIHMNIIDIIKNIIDATGSKKLKRACKKIRLFFFAVDMTKHIPSDSELDLQRKTEFNYSPLISVICPIYNTPEKFLSEMIESILAQTYSNLELCLYDTSDSEHHAVGEIIKQYCTKDSRIVYKSDSCNKGIAGNSNAAMAMASGEYTALMDHDDMLLPNALFEVVKKLNEAPADFIYTDEATFFYNPLRAYSCHKKPDFSLDFLRENNYICHLSVIKTELLRKVKGFKMGFDGSQDHDLFLRLSEETDKIAHIPKPLYLWRVNPDSFSQTRMDKCIESGIKAVREHLTRCNIKAEVTNIKNNPIYIINKIQDNIIQK